MSFINARFLRLMLPFAAGTLFVNPLGHYLSYIYYVKLPFSITGLISFYKATFGKTGANHLWFLWVLFAFSAVLTIFYGLFRINSLIQTLIGLNQ